MLEDEHRLGIRVSFDLRKHDEKLHIILNIRIAQLSKVGMETASKFQFDDIRLARQSHLLWR